VPDQAYRNALVACVFSALAFGLVLRLAARSEASPTLWLELAFVLANLIAMDWLAIRQYREIRRLQDAATPEQPVAQPPLRSPRVER
jgi:hypothetical protein